MFFDDDVQVSYLGCVCFLNAYKVNYEILIEYDIIKTPIHIIKEIPLQREIPYQGVLREICRFSRKNLVGVL